MKERPILFSGPMVRALLDGRKTQTRRIVKFYGLLDFEQGRDGAWCFRTTVGSTIVRCPYGVPGDRLWVKESWWIATPYSYGTTSGGCELDPPPLASRKRDPIHYAADGSPPNGHNRHYGPDGLQGGWFAAPDPYAVWVRRPSIHMPRWASRLTLEITEVRVERLQDISEPDAIAEGCDPIHMQPGGPNGDPGAGWISYRAGFESLWEHINGPDSWDANPWVWAVSFRVLERA